MPLAPLLRSRLQATLAVFVAGLLWWRLENVAAAGLAGLLLIFAGLAWFAPRLYAPVQRGLDRFAHALVVGFTWLVLGIVYFGLFTPMRMWRALTRQDPLRLQIESETETYFQPVPPSAGRRFDRQF